jgi:hypothetical protein
MERLRSIADRARAEAAEARAEAAEARAEIARLRTQRGDGDYGGTVQVPRKRRRWSPPIAVLLVVLGCLLAPIAVLAIWVHTELSDTDRYVETVAPLATDPAIQEAVTDRTTDTIITRLDVDRIMRQAVNAITADAGLPPVLADQLGGLAGAMSNGIHSFVQDRVGNLVRSDRFAYAWVQANRVAHQEMVLVLSGQESAITVEGDVVSLQLAPFVEVAKEKLSEAGFTVAERLPPVNPSIGLVRTDALAKAQLAYTMLNGLSVALPLVSVGSLAFGVGLARGRRRMLIAAGLGVAGGMVLLGLVVAVGRAAYLNSVSSPAAAAAIFDTVVRYLRDQLWTFGVLGLIVALGAFVTGPSFIASRIRSSLSSGIEWLQTWTEQRGLCVGTVGPWVYENVRWLRATVLVAAGLVFVVWNQPSVLVVVSLTGVVVVALAVVAFLSRPPSPHDHTDA